MSRVISKYNHNLTGKTGEDFSFTMTFPSGITPSWTVGDFSGWIKDKKTGDEYNYSFSVDEPSRTVTVSINLTDRGHSTDNKNYHHEVWYKDGFGNNYLAAEGDFTVIV